MKKNLTSFLCVGACQVACLLGSTTSLAKATGRAESRNEGHAEVVRDIPLGFALFSPIDSNGGEKIRHHFEYNLLYGDSYGLNGAALGAGVNRWRGDGQGAAMAGVANIVGGDFTGAEMSGVYNSVGQNLRGAQLGLVNEAGAIPWGAQIGLYNRSTDTQGLQDGLWNQADNMMGAQVGLVDIANNVTGTQVGLANLAQDVSGLQIGLVNIAHRNALGQIGLLNIATTNAFRVYLGAGNASITEVGLKSGAGYFFGTVGASARKTDDDRFVNPASMVLGTGVQKAFRWMTLSMSVRTEEALAEDKPLSLTAGCEVPVWDRYEIFVHGGPGFKNGLTYKQMDFLAGLQFRFKEASN